MHQIINVMASISSLLFTCQSSSHINETLQCTFQKGKEWVHWVLFPSIIIELHPSFNKVSSTNKDACYHVVK